MHNIHLVKKAICVDDYFYVVANKRQKMIGFFLLKINSRKPLENMDDDKKME